MSNNPTEPKKTVVVSAEVKAPATSQGSITTSLKSSPIFGWFYAGADMLSAELDQVAGLVSKQIDKTSETLQEMQSKGIEVEADLRRSFSPFVFFDAAQNLVKSTSVYSVLSGGQKQQRKAQQIDELSAKVDALVEQVALLATKEAAKEAVKQAEKKEAPKRASTKTAPAKTATKASTTKTAAATASKASQGKTAASVTVKATATKPSAKATAPKPSPKATASKTAAPKTSAKATAPKTSAKATASKAAPKAEASTPAKAASATVSPSNTDKKNG
ncbi:MULTISPECIES: hypothetical protein [unclassified Alteromonas]|uniref:hypothetical protein n=1 Tax=unclassified Alteromonas TaxID=2614992 RepID=UPI000509F1E7|nr:MULTISPECIES: hypothetical protein [unclassified Alteromonas]